MEANKKIWIVGGSSGIGLELVKQCLEKDYLVIASSRNATKTKELLDLKNDYPKTISFVDMDVNNESSILNGISDAWNCYDGIDIWFYNAGAYEIMSLDEWDYDKFEQMNSVNYLGVVKIMTKLLPLYKNNNIHTRWIWNCSISSYFGLPQGGGYSAPKAALVNLAESIQPELDKNNIKLQIINHGFVKTRLTEKNKFEMPQIMSPEFTAKKILEGIETSSSFEIRFPYKLSLFLRILKFLPYKFSLKLTKKLVQ
ncbi:MAG: SDR family NAD(P)-dependent oxidoreductase [Halarcobacter sp.]